MELYKRDDSPFWWYEFVINGQRHRASTKRLIANKDDAFRVMATEYAKVMDQKQFGTKPDICLLEAMERACKSVKGSTETSYKLSMRKWLGLDRFGEAGIWSLDGDMLLSALTDGDLEDHRLERQSEGLRGNSINVEIRFMQRVVNMHRKRFAVPDDLDFEKLEGFIKTRFLTDDEEAGVLDFLSKDGESYAKAKEFFIFQIDTGARLREGLEVRWSSLNLNRGLFEVYRKKTKSLSLVPLTGRVVDILKRKHNEATPFGEMSRAIKLVRKGLDTVCNDNPRIVAERGAATIHSLRDTFASRLVADGMSLHELAKLLGHSTQAMSAKYGHLEGADTAEKARLILTKRSARL